MPTYEYECTKCGKQWELFQSIKAEPERTCPKCGRATARRKIGMGAAILSGGRGGGDDAGGSRDAGASKDSGTTKGAGDAKADAGKPAAPAAKDAAAGPAASGASAKPSDDGKLNSTHPARDGRGAGNLRDAIARQRAAVAKKSGNSGAKKPAKAPRRGSR
jgi:putative FmdB family regulatory protein